MYKQQFQPLIRSEKTNVPLHIDTDPLGISFYDNDNKGSAHAIVPPITAKHQINQQPDQLSPFPSPSSSTSSFVSPRESKSFPRRVDVCRTKSQLNRRTQSLQSPTRVSAKSWESIKSPAASFLASFALSPTPTAEQPNFDVEQEGDEIDDYVLDKIIGYGGFSTVRKGFCASDGRKVAIKIIKKQTQGDEPDFMLERELAIWKTLDHANIVRLQKVLETDSATFLICDYCANGSLLDKLKKPLDEDQARRYFKEICQAVSYLHNDAKVCHKDLKLENILLDQDNNIKLCDFGLAICQQPAQVNANLPLSPEIVNDLECAAGSLAYAAPEQIKNTKAISCPTSDIWSLGIILYALVTGQLPFSDDYDLRLQQKILQGEYEMPQHLSQPLQELIQHCLAIKPEERFNIEQIMKSSWCTM